MSCIKVLNQSPYVIVTNTDVNLDGDRDTWSEGQLGVKVPVVGGSIPSSGTLQIFRKSDGVVVYTTDEQTGFVEGQNTPTLEDLFREMVIALG